jgi:hypothetical protein
MPNTFSTQAANADVLGDEAQIDGAPAGMPHEIGADGTPRERSDGTTGRETKAAEPKAGEANPGKDIKMP